ncbi:MAG: hypothetical protein SF182_23400 [Deltaproteobacteria bacterium]|nr:hypothetical protein [Deltaproteobacteria bacterium]
MPESDQISFTRIAESLQVVEQIRTAVVKDIEDRDRLKLTDSIYLQVLSRLKDSGEVAALINDQVNNRIRSILAIGGLLLGGLSLVGVTSISIYSERTARATAENVVSSMLDQRLASIRKDIESVRDEADKFQAKVAALGMQQLNEFNNALNDHLRTVDRQLEEQTKTIEARIEEKGLRVQTESAEHSRRISERAAQVLKDISDARTSALQAVADRGREKSRVVEDIPVDREHADANDSLSPETQLNVLRVMKRREYTAAVGLAREILQSSSPESCRIVLDPLLTASGQFAEKERLEAAKILVDPRLDALTQLENAREVLISAARTGDQQMFEVASRSLDENFLTEAQDEDDGLTGFARAVQGKQEKDKIDELSTALMDGDTLTPRGYANLLALSKRAGLAPAKLQMIESKVIELITEPKSNVIDRDTDYPVAYLFAETLTREPVQDREGVQRVLDRIEEFVLKGKLKDRDPFGLEKILATGRRGQQREA